PVAAQGYPAKPIRIIVPAPAGTPPDVASRVFARAMTEVIAQQVIVENRPGAGGTIGSAAVANAAPDGYTLLWGLPNAIALGPVLFPDAGFRSWTDLAPISLVNTSRFFLVVHPSVPVTTLKEFVEYAKARPGKLNYSSAGSGTVPHIVMEMFKSAAGVDLVHVPFKGNHFTTLVAGEVQSVFENPSGFAQFARAGKARPLAVASTTRYAEFPDLPTMAEAGVPFQAEVWMGVLAPRGTPTDIISRLNAATRSAVDSKALRDSFASLGTEPITNSSDEFSRFISVEVDKWTRAWKASGAKLD
ncbi:MAG: tripartite tricarboxylate transporter substrate binding protein, partial [Burkholderiales bacterium]